MIKPDSRNKRSISNTVLLTKVLLILIVTIQTIYSATAIAKNSGADFNISNIDGGHFQLSEYQGKKPVYLFFWATWCPVCKKEIPRVKALHHEFGEKIEVLAINVAINDSLENIEQYRKRYQIEYPIAFDSKHNVSSLFDVYGTPTQLVFDINGQLRYQGHRYPPGLEGFINDLSQIKDPQTF